MVIINNPSFKRDIDNVNNRELLVVLREKIRQIEAAPTIAHITGLKLLRGYSTHYRIHVKTGKLSNRIGAVVRGKTIWLVRFLSRKKIYQKFP